MTRRRSVAVAVVIGVSAAWTLGTWLRGGLEVDARLSSIAWVGGALLTSEVIFAVGLVILAISTGRAARDRGARSLFRTRREWRDVLTRVTQDPWARLGFILNWVGAAGTALTLLVAVVAVLPREAWGVAILPLLDLVATFALRLQLAGRLRPVPVSGAA